MKCFGEDFPSGGWVVERPTPYMGEMIMFGLRQVDDCSLACGDGRVPSQKYIGCNEQSDLVVMRMYVHLGQPY
jgi:hypothetical protein